MSTVAVTTPQTSAVAMPVWLLRTFALDVRALSLLRIGLGVLLLVDLAGRAPDITAHYSDDGVLPRSGRMAMQWEFCEPWWTSLHMLSGSTWWQATLFIIAALAALSLLVGYRTKPALFVSWLLLQSIHGRFPLLTQGGDMLLRCMLLWSMFLPLDACWSWSSRKHNGSRAGYFASLGTAAFIVQLAMVYLFTAMLKTGPCWRTDFSAAYYALSIDHFTSEWGYVFLGYPRLLQALTCASLLLEWLGPLLLLMPIGQRWFRLGVPLAFISFHLGLALTMDLGTFPWICILFWIVLLPPDVWSIVGFRSAKALSGATGASPVPKRANRSIPLKPQMGIGSACDEDRNLIGANILLRRGDGVAGSWRLKSMWPILARFGTGDAPVAPDNAVTTGGSFASNAICAFLLCYVVLLNINRLAFPLATVGRPPLSLVSKVVGLDQYWNMFAPGPYKFGGWVNLEGETADGRLVNLYRPHEPLPASKPANVSNSYPTQYWRRCIVTMYEFEEKPHMEGVLRYFSRQWDGGHSTEERIVRARLVHLVQPAREPFDADRSPVDVERRVLCEVQLNLVPTAAVARDARRSY